MVLNLEHKPYDQDFLSTVQDIYLMLPDPFISEGGILYDSSEELLQLQLLESDILKAEVAEKTGGGLFGGGLGKKTRDMKAKIISTATTMNVAGSDLMSGFKAGAEANKPPKSDLYDRSPSEYWEKRGSLASQKASADVNYNEAAKKYESGELGQADFESVVKDTFSEYAEIERGAAEIGSSLQSVTSHVEHLHNETKGVMPPTEQFPDGATKSGEAGSGKKLYGSSSKNLSGSLWNAEVKKKGKKFDEGKIDVQRGMIGPGEEGAEAKEAYKEGGGQAGERERTKAALGKVDETIAKLPQGSGVPAHDREYLTKPGQKPPEGVRIQFGDKNQQGKVPRFYSKTEASMRRMAKKQKEQDIADKYGPEAPKEPEGDPSEGSGDRGEAAKGIKREIEDYPDALRNLRQPTEKEIEDFLNELFPKEPDKPKPIDPPDPSDPSKPDPSDPSIPDDPTDPSKPDPSDPTDPSDPKDPSKPGPGPGPSPTPTPRKPRAKEKYPRDIGKLIRQRKAVNEAAGELEAVFDDTQRKINTFATDVNEGRVYSSKKQANEYVGYIEEVMEAALPSREANSIMVSAMDELMETHRKYVKTEIEIGELEDSKKTKGDLSAARKKRLSKLEIQKNDLETERTNQVASTKKYMANSMKAQGPLGDSFTAVTDCIQGIKDNPPGRLTRIGEGVGKIIAGAGQVLNDPIVAAAVAGTALTAANVAASLDDGDELDLVDDPIEKQYMEQDEYSSLLQTIDECMELVEIS